MLTRYLTIVLPEEWSELKCKQPFSHFIRGLHLHLTWRRISPAKRRTTRRLVSLLLNGSNFLSSSSYRRISLNPPWFLNYGIWWWSYLFSTAGALQVVAIKWNLFLYFATMWPKSCNSYHFAVMQVGLIRVVDWIKAAKYEVSLNLLLGSRRRQHGD